VAVKVIHPANAVNLAEWRARWQRQAELLRSLDHSGLVKVRDVFEGPVPHLPGAADLRTRSLFLVMNWVEGSSLEQWVLASPDRSVADVLRVLDVIAGAIDHLHSGAVGGYAIVHRDIKPANVIINGAQAWLVDFGFARLLTDEPMTMVGTPTYLAPEVVRTGRYSPATDRYAFGGTAYFALTGDRPNPDAWGEMADRVAAVPGVAGRADVVQAVLAALAPDPSQRPASCADWIRGLRSRLGSAAGPLGTTAAPPLSSTPPLVDPGVPRPVPAAPTPSHPRWHPAVSSPGPAVADRAGSATTWVLAGIVVVLLVVSGVLVGYVLRRGSHGPDHWAVPVVTGLDVSAAHRALRDAGFPADRLEVRCEVSALEAGRVVAVEPGERAQASRVVMVVAARPDGTCATS
jgi:serine/threonine protein kinase